MFKKIVQGVGRLLGQYGNTKPTEDRSRDLQGMGADVPEPLATPDSSDSRGSEINEPVVNGETPNDANRNHLIEAYDSKGNKVRLMQIVDPSIYIISHSQLTTNNNGDLELQRFLNQHTRTGGEKQPYFFENPDNGEIDPYDLDNIPEIAGRLCYMSFDKPRPGGNGAYIGHIRETGHGSVLEHAIISLVLTGASRSLTHELVRHRAGFGFSQLSQRFVDHEPTGFGGTGGGTSDAIEGHWSFVCPLALMGPGRERARKIWLKHMIASIEAYQDLSDELSRTFATTPSSGVLEKVEPLSLKQQREAARSVLPNSTETKIFVTCNFRSLRHLFHMRGSVHADREIRRMVRKLYDKIKDLDISKELLADVTISDSEQDILTVGYPHV